MIVRLLRFRDTITEKVAEAMHDIGAWHDACTKPPVPMATEGHCMLRDEDGNIRLIVVGEGGEFGFEMELDVRCAIQLHDGLCRAIDDMKADVVDEFIEALSVEDVKEITDVIGGMFTSIHSDPAES